MTNRGFTLLEILISLTILAIIMSIVYTLLIATLKARDWIRSSVEIERVASRLITILTRDIQSAYFYQIEDSCFLGKSGFAESRLDFITNMDSLVYKGDIRSDISEVSYFLRPNPNLAGTYKLMRREDFFVDNNPQKGGYLVCLYERISKLQFRFYNEKGMKKENWNSKLEKGLPIGVQVILELAESNDKKSHTPVKRVHHFQAYIPILVSPKSPSHSKTKKKE